MLVDGEWAALIGGYGADYDLITPVRIELTVSMRKVSRPAGRARRDRDAEGALDVPWSRVARSDRRLVTPGEPR